MSYEKMYKLVDLLIQKTQNDQIKWDKTPSDDAFQTSFPETSILLMKSEHYSDANLYTISFFNKEGVLVESINDEDLDAQKNAYGRAQKNYYNLLQNTFNTARRKALGVEDILDNVLNALNSKNEDEIPF